MLKPSINLKLGVPLLVVAFIVSFLALYGGALLVDREETAASDGGGGPNEGEPTNVTIVAQNLKFDKDSITANAGLEVTVTLDNRDAGVLHNVAFYTNRSASSKIFGGGIITGPATEKFSFPAPAAGSYFFRCDVHPDTMTGAFIVR
ncbi:MAG TPA: cupredoxin domain-containing protein [Dehalococcoidia bacterium]|jgi:plastocyanin|nr:cupredoxin domain-containing protein [Dehalococcoidia bacterium]